MRYHTTAINVRPINVRASRTLTVNTQCTPPPPISPFLGLDWLSMTKQGVYIYRSTVNLFTHKFTQNRKRDIFIRHDSGPIPIPNPPSPRQPGRHPAPKPVLLITIHLGWKQGSKQGSNWRHVVGIRRRWGSRSGRWPGVGWGWGWGGGGGVGVWGGGAFLRRWDTLSQAASHPSSPHPGTQTVYGFHDSIKLYPLSTVYQPCQTRINPVKPHQPCQTCTRPVKHVPVLSNPYQPCQTCTSPVKPVPVLSNPYQPCQTCTSPVKPVPALSNPYQSCQTCTSPVKPVPALSNLYQPCQTCTSPVKPVPVLSNLCHPVKPVPALSNPYQPCQTCTSPVKPVPVLSNLYQPCQTCTSPVKLDTYP